MPDEYPLFHEKSTDVRPDGSPKGLGFLGPLHGVGGDVRTEYSVGVPIGGREMDIPTLVPTLTEKELQFLLNHQGSPNTIPDSIIYKAIAHAEGRIASGKPIYAGVGEQQDTLYPTFKRASVKQLSGDIRLPAQPR